MTSMKLVSPPFREHSINSSTFCLPRRPAAPWQGLARHNPSRIPVAAIAEAATAEVVSSSASEEADSLLQQRSLPDGAKQQDRAIVVGERPAGNSLLRRLEQVRQCCAGNATLQHHVLGSGAAFGCSAWPHLAHLSGNRSVCTVFYFLRRLGLVQLRNMDLYHSCDITVDRTSSGWPAHPPTYVMLCMYSHRCPLYVVPFCCFLMHAGSPNIVACHDQQ